MTRDDRPPRDVWLLAWVGVALFVVGTTLPHTRAQLLREVWGYDFYGGTRTVDVHVRRLRSKLGPELEHLIETVRGVGYRAADDR